jgi:ATP-binding cassette subfamily C (CFTR/MRP) protein 1
VGKALFNDVIVDAVRSQGKTVIFVTHALHFLSSCDYIYTLSEGQIAEQGTYQELIEADGEFARLDKEFGGGDSTEQFDDNSDDVGQKQDGLKEKLATKSRLAAAGTGKLEGKLLVKEHRTTGSISGKGASSVQY